MKVRRFLHVVVCLSFVTGCYGPRSTVEVQHLADLVEEGRREYLEDLIKALGSGDPHVRDAAIDALAALGEKTDARLKEVIRERSRRSGPALLALGRGGSPDSLELIRSYRGEPELESWSTDAEKALDQRLYARVAKGDLEGMELYLEAFPDSPKADEIRETRRATLAFNAFEKVEADPNIADIETFLKTYADTAQGPEARILLARLLVKEAQASLDKKAWADARDFLDRAGVADTRRELELQRMKAESWLAEGRELQAANKEDEALKALQTAGEFSELKLEADRAQSEIRMKRARRLVEQGRVREAIVEADLAQKLDPLRREEVSSVKTVLARGFQTQIQSTEAAQRKAGLEGLISVGEEAAGPMEVYLGTLFVRKDYAAVEEVVQALAEVRRATPATPSSPGVTRVAELLTNYLRTALASSTTEVTRLFGSTEFLRGWNQDLDPLDPRQSALVFRVEELTTRHLGLSRVGLTMKVLLGEVVVDVVRGSLLKDDEVMERLRQGQVGNDPSMALLTRVQLCARYATLTGELNRTARANLELFMAYAVGFGVPPVHAVDWMNVAQAWQLLLQRSRGGDDLAPDTVGGGLRTFGSVLASLDFDQRSLTLQVVDPGIADPVRDPGTRPQTILRVEALLLNTVRIATGLYSGIDRYTVLLGSVDGPTNRLRLEKGKRFEPWARLMITQKNLAKLDFNKIRALNGGYGPTEIEAVDLQWYRWNH